MARPPENRRTAGRKLPGQAQRQHARDVDVGNDHVRAFARGARNGLFHGCGQADHLDTAARERLLRDLGDAPVVVEEEDADRGFGHLGHLLRSRIAWKYASGAAWSPRWTAGSIPAS